MSREHSPARAGNGTLARLPDDDEVLTVKQWCALNSISKSTGERILGGPKSQRPRIVWLSEKRRGITKGDNRIWQEGRRR